MKFEMDPDAMAHVTECVDRLFVDHLGPQMARTAMEKAPIDTGHLKSSVYFRLEMHKLIIGDSADYAAYVETGTRPHLITSHGDYPLRNRRTGQVFGRVVHHPGTRPQPYLRPAVYRNWLVGFANNSGTGSGSGMTTLGLMNMMLGGKP